MNAQIIADAAKGIKNPDFKYDATTDVGKRFKSAGWSEPNRDRQRAMKLLLNGVDFGAVAGGEAAL